MLKYLYEALKEKPLPGENEYVFSEKQAELLALHWEKVKNAGFNLTAITEDEEAAVKHYWDCLYLARFLPPNALCLDIGSGAGFPGLVLATVRADTKWLLLDSLNKRCRFLQSAAEDMGLDNVKVLHARAEDAAHDKEYRERFDCVVARAVIALPALSEYTLPFLKKDGLFLAMKGANAEDELNAAQNALRILKGKVKEKIVYTLPFYGDGRTLYVIEKTAPCPAQYPRKAGTPKAAPL